MLVEKDVVLTGRYATGYRQDGSVVEATHLFRDDALCDSGFIPPQYVLDGLTVSLVTVWSMSFFHWVMEELTMLCSLKFREISHILLPVNPPSYVLETLDFLGLTDRIENWIGTPTKVNLLHAGPQRIQGINNLSSIRNLRRHFHPTKRGYPTRIYISRGDATSRMVLNESLFTKSLRKHYKFTLSGMPFQEQVNLFSGAKSIIAPHGAGLTNMVWAEPGIEVVELFGSYHNPCYQKLAYQLKHDYTRIDCRPMGDNMFAPLEE